ncbi:MerR family DNA-binding transcriptional regulator [Paenibacillus sp. Z3-2]
MFFHISVPVILNPSVSKQRNISVRTLRYYDQIGLL